MKAILALQKLPAVELKGDNLISCGTTIACSSTITDSGSCFDSSAEKKS